MKYLSDVEDNRQLVKATFYTDGSPTEPAFIESCYQTSKEILALAASPNGKKDIVKAVINVKYELAVWKAISLSDNWIQFITDLQLAGVPVRSITLIKQIVEEEFKSLLQDSKYDEGGSEKIQTIRNVKSVTTWRDAEGLVVRIELV